MAKRRGARILVVDDHAAMGRLLADQLGEEGYVVERAEGGLEALRRVRAELPDLVLTDLRMEDVDGFDVLRGVHEVDPDLPVLVMTAFGAIETAVEAIKRGAYHYLTKPFQLAEVLVFVERALADREVRAANEVLRHEAEQRSGAVPMVGIGPGMRALQEVIAKAAPSPAPVLITGESGTGKELVARALHDASPRRDRPFVAVNCTTFPEGLLESELFGHTRGAFTGATSRRGLFVEADRGTLLLDEIGDMPLPLQAKMLRVLQDGTVRAVGSDTVRRVDVRIVAATNQDLDERMRAGQFRSDLFYRLHVLSIAVPPLRDRREDVPELVECFVARARQRNPGARALRVAKDAVERLAAHTWPGNVRELENVVERLVILVPREEIGVEDLEAFGPRLAAEPSPLARAQEQMMTMRQLEDAYIAWVVTRCGGNKTRAAEVLGIDVSTIHRRDRSAAR
jgi:two-component system response regulator HydG